MSRRLVFGAGIKDIRTHHGCPYYERWKGVLRRCYSKSGEIPASYDGCRIAEEWLVFSNFKHWMVREGEKYLGGGARKIEI